MNLEKLKDKIASSNYKVISFDIFDTLLLRPCFHPTDILRLVGLRCGYQGDFIGMRRIAEREARKIKPFFEDEITYDDIYNCFGDLFDFSQDEIEKFKSIELDIEYKYLYARKSMKEIYNYAQSIGKEIIIVSDMYLSEDFLSRVLKKNGYDKYNKLYVSSEYKITKSSGKLYDYIIKEYEQKGILAKEILHLGDNEKSDVAIAKNKGISTEYIARTEAQFRKSRKLGELFNNRNKYCYNSYLIGFAANTIFDDPYVEYDFTTRFNGLPKNMSIILFAPFILSFVKWMLDDSIKEEIETMCLVYRDGYLPEMILNILRPFYGEKFPKLKQIYLSRAVINKFYANKKNGLYESLSNMLANDSMTVGDFIKTRLFVEDENEFKEVLDIFRKHGYGGENDVLKDRNKYMAFTKELESFYVKNALPKIEIILRYCSQILKDSGKTAVFDIGYRGSACQFLLNYLNMKTIGYHLYSKELLKYNNINGLNVKSCITYGLDTERDTLLVNCLTEDLLNSQEASVVDIEEKDGSFILKRDTNGEYFELIDIMQNEIISYIQRFVDLFRDDIKLINFDTINYFEFYQRALRAPTNKDIHIFKYMDFIDSSFMNPSAQNSYKKWMKKFKKSAPNVLTQNNGNHLDDWEPSALRLRIYFFLMRIHLLVPAKKVLNIFRKIRDTIIGKEKLTLEQPYKNVMRDMEASIDEIEDNLKYRIRPTIIFAGHIAAFDKGSCHYINELSNHINADFVLLSEVPYMRREQVAEKINSNIEIQILRKVPMNKGYDSAISVILSTEAQKLICEKKYLREAIINIKARFHDMGENYPELLVVYLYKYYKKIIEVYRQENAPVIFIMWNEFTAMHHILKNVCFEENVEILFMEFGPIPGTFIIESHGQMGESFPACKPREFKSQFVSEEEIKKTKELLKFLKDSGLNRNKQPINNNVEILKKQLKRSRPVITYFGQNDYESGLYPYTENTKEFHSPAFKTSNELAEELVKLAKKYDWNFIYKPHPLIYSPGDNYTLRGKNVFYVSDVDINELIDISDVVVTILSASSYNALIRDTATVMVGYTQLKGKGCTYEAFKKEELEKTICDAVKKGYTVEQKFAFYKHCAQMNKFYQYDDLTSKKGTWGRSVQDCAEFISNVVRTESSKINFKRKDYMKVAIVSSMPKNYYSGGRSHAWNVAESLAYKGNEVYFITNNPPIFKDEMSENQGHKKINLIVTKDFKPKLDKINHLDYVILVPERSRSDVFYRRVRNFAIQMNAKLVLLNFESENWINSYLDEPIDPIFWKPWLDVCKDGCLIQSSDLESMRYAKEFYNVNPQYTCFDYWYPPINTFAADQVGICPKENRIVAMIRLKDRYKGSFDILEMIDEYMRGYTLVLIYGSGEKGEVYNEYVKQLDEICKKYDVNYEIKVQLNDVEKFSEISRAKIMLFPSYFEGYGTPPIEAQYCETVCLVYDLPVLRETCGNSVVYCEHKNPQDMKLKLKQLIENDVINTGMRQKIYDIAEFKSCADKLDKMLKRHLDDDWRDPFAHTSKI